MSSGKVAGHQSLWADLSFSDLWRAVQYHQRSGLDGLPSSLDAAYAARFAGPSQPWAVGGTVGTVRRASDLDRTREAA